MHTRRRDAGGGGERGEIVAKVQWGQLGKGQKPHSKSSK